MALSCLTDFLDGWIARHFDQITDLGKILDPLADKVTQFALTFCLTLRHPVLMPVLVLFLIKEAFQVVLGILFLSKGQMLDGALPEGKICTAFLFVTLTVLVLFPQIHPAIVNAIAAADIVFLSVSLLGYNRAYLGKSARIQDLKKYGGSK